MTCLAPPPTAAPSARQDGLHTVALAHQGPFQSHEVCLLLPYHVTRAYKQSTRRVF